MSVPEADPFSRDQWYAIVAIDELARGAVLSTRLLDIPIRCRRLTEGGFEVARGDSGAALPVLEAYGYVWTSTGQPPDGIFAIPEWDEPDRRRLNAATLGVNVSAPRAIENFLDMGHFPFVHTDILGAEPRTEVKEYDVEISEERDEILATRCRFFQPMASQASSGGAEVDYVYRVPHPVCAILYKSSPVDESRLDVIALFLQPMSEESVRAHMLLCVLDTDNEDKVISRFQQTIFGQDKPILENQFPKRLPLDPRAETPIRADRSAIAYRRWLSRKGLRYGVIPAGTDMRAGA